MPPTSTAFTTEINQEGLLVRDRLGYQCGCLRTSCVRWSALERQSKMSPSSSGNCPLGTKTVFPRFTIMTSVPCGTSICESKLPFSSMASVSVTSRNFDPNSSGISTPNSLPVFSSGMSRLSFLAESEMVVPWMVSDSSVMKNTMLNKMSAPSTPLISG